MKTFSRIVVTGVLGVAALLTGASVQAADDVDTCRGGYSIMLMTKAECRTYLKNLKDVRARADRMAELELREWHTELLIERAEACPCLRGQPRGQPRVVGERTVSNQQQ
jgi:hypothetical protein